MTKKDDLILVGVISGAHGINGNLLIKSYTEPITNIGNYQLQFLPSAILPQQFLEPFKVKVIRANKNQELVCSLANCKDRNIAELLRFQKIFCDKSELPPISEEGVYYFSDLIDLDVLDSTSNKIGHVVDVANFGAGDIIVIQFDSGSEEMLPFTNDFFPEITQEYVKCSDEALAYLAI